ncbi:TIM-barrel domain-containing protein [Sphingomonas sp. ac-8]|uniref:glycoside hydrolase family 31 protein n=1 Tax=Sphingomonas sp. ac-8 TaxID=3242977 RepID=UPI003A7F8B3B
MSHRAPAMLARMVKSRATLPLLLACASVLAPAASAQQPTQPVQPAMQGQASQGAVVERGPARFTVLTPHLIRMEWAENGRFVDAPSQVFVNRAQPVPAYTVRTRSGVLEIQTDALTLTYRIGSGRFDKSNLRVRSRRLKPAFDWHPGDPESGNLGGTARTVDRYSGDRHIDSGEKLDLGQGLLSRAGWHVLDDSASFLFSSDPWPWAQKRACADCQDLYFFGYGHDYRRALSDYASVAGREPMPPRYAFGYWWSRYWNYSDREMRELVNDFERYRLPLDVMVVDMDWHRTDGLSWDERHVQRDVFGQSVGWTGYTWNRSLFPEPGKLLAWLHGKGLKTTLNLHPASGIPSDEETYPAFAKAMGITGGAPVPFEAADPRFVRNWFDITLDPLTRAGVDFWWLDWQQWADSKAMPGLSNTWWLNYVFYSHMQRTEAERAMIYHRWGGMGNHRYQIGFSGDSVISWPSLAYQPYFTATASNVLYGYWSHDIGGHFFAETTPVSERQIDPELYVRWMQFGAFSPILRTHSAKEAGLRKEPWRFSPDVFAVLRDTIDQRYRMAPYIYTAARQAYDSGVSIMRPLYYDWPEEAHAYQTTGEYMFGDDMLVAPVTAPMKDGVANVSIWLPPGRWYDTNRGELVSGGRTVERDYRLEEIPVFVRAGAVVPMYPESVRKLQKADDRNIVVRAYPGGEAERRMYADAGDSERYRDGQYAFTTITSRYDDRRAAITVRPREGRYVGMAPDRQITIELPSARFPSRVTVNGRPYDRTEQASQGGWHYAGDTLTASITIPAQAADTEINVVVDFADSSARIDGLLYRMKRVRTAVDWLKNQWEPPAPLPDDVSLAAELGQLIEYHPERLDQLMQAFDARVERLAATVSRSRATPEVKARFAALIASVNDGAVR